MDEKLQSELRGYTWDYFALHADQRIKTFNFYLILFGLVSGGLITPLKDGQNYRLGAPVALALAFVSFIFWRLDIRNKELIKNSEEALKLLERDDRLPDEGGSPNRLKLFTYEEHATGLRKKERFLGFIPKHYSYSTCFHAVFLAFGLAGLITGVVLLFLRQPNNLCGWYH